MEIFTELSDDEKEKILVQAIRNKINFVFKYPNSKIMRARVDNLHKKHYVSCRRPKETLVYRPREEVVVIMAMEGERYFFKSRIHADSEYIYFKKDSPFFFLMRRKNKRYRVPSGFPINFMIKKQNGNLTFLKAIVIDFSENGCKAALNTDVPSFEIGDKISGALNFHDKKNIEIQGQVKHIVKSAAGIFKQTFGLQFEITSSQLLDKLKSLFIELQNEVFIDSYLKKH